jgi:cytochrome P450
MLERDAYVMFDHNEPDHRRGIESRWSEMRACPLLPHSEKHGGFHVVTRFHDVAAVTRQHKIFSSADGIAIPDIHIGSRLLPIESDPPVQGRYRRIVMPFLAKAAVAIHEDFVRSLTRELLEELRGMESFEFGDGFALPLPCRTMLHVLGLPDEDAKLLDRLITTSIDGRGTAAAEAAGAELHAYLARFVDAKAAIPLDPDDIVSVIAHAEIEAAQIGRSERLALTKLLLFGGFTTTTFVLTSAMRWLGDHPLDWDRLSADQSLIPGAIEEFVRYASPGTYLGRTVIQDTTLASVPLCSGEKILVSYGSANRDPEVFESPEEILLERNPTQHMGFGHGTHACIGLHLARLELRVAFEELTGAIAKFAFDHEAPIKWSSGETQGMTQVRLTTIKWR